MNRIECHITRPPELAEKLNALLSDKHWSRHRWAIQAGVGYSSVRRIFHQGGQPVSKELFAGAVEILTQDPQEQIKLFGLAGIAIYRRNGQLFKLL